GTASPFEQAATSGSKPAERSSRTPLTSAASRTHRVVRRGAAPKVDRLDIGALDRIIPPAPREMRHETLRRLRVEEDVGLVRPSFDGRTSEFGEPDRLGLRRQRRRRPAFHPARVVVMRVRPRARELEPTLQYAAPHFALTSAVARAS